MSLATTITAGFTQDERQGLIWRSELRWSDVTPPRWHCEDMQYEAGPRAVIQPSRVSRRHAGYTRCRESRSFPPSVCAPVCVSLTLKHISFFIPLEKEPTLTNQRVS